MEDSIFTRIIKSEIPCHKVYEDDLTFAFMDIHPVQPGQVLVVPKRQVADAWDLNDQDYQALMSTAKKIALRMREIFADKARVGMQIEGLDVAHVHLKLFPFDTAEEFRHKPDMSVEPDHVSLAAIAEKLML